MPGLYRGSYSVDVGFGLRPFGTTGAVARTIAAMAESDGVSAAIRKHGGTIDVTYEGDAASTTAFYEDMQRRFNADSYESVFDGGGRSEYDRIFGGG